MHNRVNLNKMDVKSAVSKIGYYTEGILEFAKNSESGQEKIWVIVESDDDCEVYGKFLLDDDNVKLRDSGCKEKGKNGQDGIRRGWERLERLLNTYVSSLTIIGIRDKDYTPFLQQDSKLSNLFETDSRDLEMMMIKAGVLKRFLPDMINGTALSDVLAVVYDHTRYLGYLRIMNDVKKLYCDFNGFLKMSHFWSQTTHSYDVNWKSNITANFVSHCPDQVTEEQITQFIYDKNLSSCLVYDVCRGHDVVEHLSWNLVKNKYSKKVLKEEMKVAYTYTDFQATQLYKDLRSWERLNNRLILHDSSPA